MVQFNELRINPEGTKLIIDVSVKDSVYYENVYIDTILIDTQDTFIDSGPSSNVVYTNTLTGDNKSVRLELGTGDLLPSLKENLFFVYVRTKGIPSSDTPCGMDNATVLGTTLYPYNIYCDMIKTLQLEYTSPCNPPRKFIDYFFRYKALQLSLITGNSLQAIKYFNSLLKNTTQVSNNIYKCYGS